MVAELYIMVVKYNKEVMNKTIMFLAIWLSITSLQAQPKISQQEKDIQQTVIRMFEALSNRDSVALKAECANDISLYEYGQIWNMDSLIQKAIIQNLSADFKRTNRFEFIRSIADQKTGWVTYQLQSDIIKEGHRSLVLWLETVGLVKEGKKWKIKHLHSTLLKRN